MSNHLDIPSIVDRTYLWVARRSWRIRQHTSKVIHLNGPLAKIKVPIINGVGYPNVYCDREILYPLLAWLTHCQKGAFIDIGANIGQTLLVTLFAGRLEHYIGFEPNTLCCSYLHKLIDVNSFRQCLVLPFGLSDSFRIAELSYNADSDVCASTTPGFRPKEFFRNREVVLLVPGDEMLHRFQLDRVAIIKIDVEGGELEVVRGIRETIGRYKPFLLLEVLPHLHLEKDRTVFPGVSEEERQHIVAERKRRTEALESLLQELGYVWYRIEANGDLTPTPWMRAAGPEQRTEMNFLATHESRKMELEGWASGRLRLNP